MFCVSLLDLSKAFKRIPRGLLIAKFLAYVLTLSACDLLTSYLSNIHQRDKIKGSRSEWRAVKRTQPWAHYFLISSLMTCFILLKNVYITIKTTTPYLLCVHDVVASLETDCNNFMWFSVNGLQAKPSKFQVMLLSSSILINITYGVLEISFSNMSRMSKY